MIEVALILKKGLLIYWKNLSKLYQFQLIIFLSNLILLILTYFRDTAVDINSFRIMGILVFLFTIVNSVCTVFVTIVMVVMISNIYLDKDLNFKNIYIYARRKFFTYIGGVLTYGLLIVVSGILFYFAISIVRFTLLNVLLVIALVIPLIYVATKYSLIPYIACLEENPKFIERSQEIMKGNLGIAFGTLLISSFIFMIPSLGMNAMRDNIRQLYEYKVLEQIINFIRKPFTLCVEVTLLYTLIKRRFTKI